jgi:hypothetical protein
LNAQVPLRASAKYGNFVMVLQLFLSRSRPRDIPFQPNLRLVSYPTVEYGQLFDGSTDSTPLEASKEHNEEEFDPMSISRHTRTLSIAALLACSPLAVYAQTTPRHH